MKRREKYIRYDDDDEEAEDDDKVKDILRGNTSHAQHPQTGGRNQAPSATYIYVYDMWPIYDIDEDQKWTRCNQAPG